MDLTYGRKGVELLRGVEVNPYAALRFADQHPLLRHRSFISIDSIATPLVSIAPFAANLKVEQNIVSLSQLEMGVRGGSITGDGVLDWNGADSTFRVNVRASGVKSSQGEPFDGNAALLLDFGIAASMAERTSCASGDAICRTCSSYRIHCARTPG